jgi:DNA repair protein RecO (recombination protein O)
MFCRFEYGLNSAMAANEMKQPYIEVTAMVIGWTPVGEYDRRVVLLTKEMGKISAFAKGARRPGSSLVASTDIFCFGRFRLYAGRNSYTLQEAGVLNYFEFFRTHIEESMYGQYFMEVCEWCTRENNDEAMLLLLTYQSLRALESPAYPNALVRSIFEIKTVALEGEFPGLLNPQKFLPATVKAVETIVTSPIQKLYSFALEEQAMHELARIAREYMDHCFEHHKFRSLEVMRVMGLGR